MKNSHHSNYKWYILSLAALTHTFSVAMPIMCMPVLFSEISDELGLSLVEVGTIWGMFGVAGIFVSLFGGLIGDRIGTKRMLAFGCLTAGLAGALRGLAVGFTSLAATVVLFGLATTMVPMGVHKTCGVWFTGKRLGLANGVVAVGMALGFLLGSMFSATVLSPLLGGWRNVLFLYGAISLVISFLWFLTRTKPAEVGQASGDSGTVPFRRAVSRVVRIKQVWVIALVVLGVGGCYQGMLGYLPLYLREIGWEAASADGALAAFHGISMMATIPITLLSDRLGIRKPILFIAALMAVIGVGLLSVVSGPLVWVAVLIAGMVRDGFMAVYVTMVIETERVGAAYTGTALGLIYTLGRLGNVFSPPVGNSFASFGLNVPFMFWAAWAAVALIGFYFIKDARVGKGVRMLATEEIPSDRL